MSYATIDYAAAGVTADINVTSNAPNYKLKNFVSPCLLTIHLASSVDDAVLNGSEIDLKYQGSVVDTLPLVGTLPSSISYQSVGGGTHRITATS